MLRIDVLVSLCNNYHKGSDILPKNYLLVYSEQLATDIELLCQNIKAPSNTIFQIRKSSSSVYANIREANYGQSKADMLSKFEIALKECSETEGWVQFCLTQTLLMKFYTKSIEIFVGVSGEC